LKLVLKKIKPEVNLNHNIYMGRVGQNTCWTKYMFYRYMHMAEKTRKRKEHKEVQLACPMLNLD